MASSDLHSEPAAAETNGHGTLMTVGGRMSTLAPVPWPYGPPARPEILSAKANPVTLLHALRRRWTLAVGLGFVVATTLAAAVWFFVPVKYEAAALFHVKSRENHVLQSVAPQIDYLGYKRTQQQLIKSHSVVSDALRDLKTKEPGLMIFKEHPEDAVEWLEDSLTVENPGDGEIVRLALRGDKPKELAKLVNAVGDAYKQLVVDKEETLFFQDIDALKGAFDTNRLEISKNQQTIQQLQKTLHTSGSESAVLQKQMLRDQLNDLRLRASRANEEISKIDTKIALYEARAEKLKNFRPPDSAIEEVLGKDPMYQELKKESMKANMAVHNAGLRTDGNNRYAQQARATLSEIQDQIDEYKAERIPQIIEQLLGNTDPGGAYLVPFLQVEKESWEKSLGELTETTAEKLGEIGKLENYSTELEAKKSALKTLESVTDQIAAKLDILKIEAKRYKSRVEKVEPATDPRTNDAMRKYLGMGFAWLVGLGLVLFGVAFVEFQSRKLNTSRDVNEGLGIRVMGDLPALSGKLLRRMQSGQDAGLEHLLTESIDTIRTALIHSNGAEPPRVVLVTSADSREGKTTVASQLAASLARTGRKTLLIDGDVRKPAAHQLFGRPLGPGLCEVLRGEVEVDGTIQPTDAPNLWLIPAGEVDAGSVQAFSSDLLAKAIDELRPRFDFIVVDSPPVLKVADPLLLGLHADTAILSVQRDVSKMPDVYAASERLRSVGIHVLGAVVNGMQMKLARRGTSLPPARSA